MSNVAVLRAAQARIRTWRADPIAFVRENFAGVEPDAWQAEVLRNLPRQDGRYRRQAMCACAGPGKSCVMAWAGLWFMACMGEKGEHPKGVAVAVTLDNLRANLWPEFAKWRARSPYLTAAFEWTNEKLFAKDHPQTWFFSARSWSKTADSEEQGRTLSGMHSKFVMAILDESGEIPMAVAKAAEQALSNCKWGKIVQAGNPTSTDGMLYEAATSQADKWMITRITGDPDDANRSPRIDIEWARDQIKQYGRDNPWVQAYILGQFPSTGLNTLLGVEDVRRSMDGGFKDASEYNYSQKRIGVDVARFGADRTILFPRQGLRAFDPVVMRGAKTHEIAARIVAAKEKWKSEVEMIDDCGGWAAGVIDSAALGNVMILPVNGSGRASDTRYFNKRSEMYFKMAEWVKNGGVLPKIPELIKELCAPTYWFEKGKFRVEEKEQIKKRLSGLSPDLADALCYTFCMPDQPSSVSPEGVELSHVGNVGKVLTERPESHEDTA